MEEKRNITIDILKTIGIFCIILAHVCKSKFILQSRNFDVPLMVICSAFLYKSQYGFDIKRVFKRIIRLVIPVWIFFVCFFLYKYIISFEFGIK